MSGPSGLSCPKCSTGLSPLRGEDVVLHGCPSCRGIWMDNTACQKLLSGTLAAGTQQLVARVDAGATQPKGQRPDSADPTRKIACPVCGSALTFTRTPFDGVCVDACANHGTWFDANEIRAIAQALAIKAASDDAFVEGEIAEMRHVAREELLARTALGRLLKPFW